jgi:hypothetical protein
MQRGQEDNMKMDLRETDCHSKETRINWNWMEHISFWLMLLMLLCWGKTYVPQAKLIAVLYTGEVGVEVNTYVLMSFHQNYSDWLWAGWPRGQSLSPGKGKIFSSPHHLDWFWGPPSLLSNGYWGFFFQEQSSWGIKLTTHLQLVQRSKLYMDLYIHSPICLYGVVLS